MSLNPNNTAFIYPGQGSQFVGMGKELAADYPAAMQVFLKADEILGISLSKLAWEGPEELLNDTLNTQPALYTHSMAALEVFNSLFPDFHPKYVAGHSLGELSAVAAAGAITFEDGLKLVRRRGELMKHAGEISPGGMAAVLGLDIPTLEGLCQQASEPGNTIQVANDNCPGQVVVSGYSEAVDRLLSLAEAAGAKRAVRLAVSIAAHSELMRPVQEEFGQSIKATPFNEPEAVIIGNVTARPLTVIANIQDDIRNQLTSRVRWTETVQYLIEQGVENFIEMGSGEVLIGLIRRIDRNVNRYKFGAPEDINELKAALNQ
jgi:[acyl-carrier-protein] S-malonyltransferase